MSNDVGERIRSKRKLKGYTKLDMSEKLGVHLMYYTNVEYGSKKATIVLLSRIASILETSTQYLLGGTEDAALTVRSHGEPSLSDRTRGMER